MRKTKEIFSRRRNSGGGFVGDTIDTHPRADDLRATLAQWVRDPSQVESRFAEAVNEYLVIENDHLETSTLAEERSDLRNIDEAIVDLRSRLEHFPERAAAMIYAVTHKRMDVHALLDRVTVDLGLVRGAIALVMPPDKLQSGHKKKLKATAHRQNLRRQLALILNEFGRRGAGDAEMFTSDVIEIIKR